MEPMRKGSVLMKKCVSTVGTRNKTEKPVDVERGSGKGKKSTVGFRLKSDAVGGCRFPALALSYHAHTLHLFKKEPR